MTHQAERKLWWPTGQECNYDNPPSRDVTIHNGLIQRKSLLVEVLWYQLKIKKKQNIFQLNASVVIIKLVSENSLFQEPTENRPLRAPPG